MSTVAIFPWGNDREGHRFWASQEAPPAGDFIASVTPAGTPYTIQQPHLMSWIEIDTTNGDCLVTAQPWVVLPNEEARAFSYWQREEVPIEFGEALRIKRGDAGGIGLNFSSDLPFWWRLLLKMPKPWAPTWTMRLLYKLYRHILVPPTPPPPSKLTPAEEEAIRKALAKTTPGATPVLTPVEVITEKEEEVLARP